MDKLNKIIVCIGIVLIFFAPSLAFAESYSNNDWPMFHRDIAHTGYSDAPAPMTDTMEI